MTRLAPIEKLAPASRSDDVGVGDLGSGPDRQALAYGWALAVIVLAAFVVRAIPLTNGLPYPSYVDEHFVLRPAAFVYAERAWDPDFYIYPPLLIYATAAVAFALGLLPGGSNVGVGAQATLDQPIRSNILSPDLILGGRLVVLVLSVGTVLVVGLLARRLMGRRAGIVAAMLVAAIPGLVSRSAIVIVDTPAAFFATVSLLCAAHLPRSRRPILVAPAAGVAAGLAGASKYTAGVVVLAVLTVIVLQRERTIAQRVRLGVMALAATGMTFIMAAPTVLLRTRTVINETRNNVQVTYEVKQSTTYWRELLSRNEAGWLLVVVAGIGIVLLLASRRSRAVTLGFGVFAVALVGPLVGFPFQPFRNVVPLLPFIAVAAAAAVVGAIDGLRRFLTLNRATTSALALLCAVGLAGVMINASWPYYRASRIDLADSRIEAREWLQAHTQADEDVLIAAEVGFVASELDRLPGRAVIRSLKEAETAGSTTDFEYIVVGDFGSTKPWREAVYDRDIRASFGRRETLTHPRAYRYPRQSVRLFGSPATRDTSECVPLCG